MGLRPGQTNIGSFQKGFKHSKEAKMRMSENRRGENNGFFGKKHGKKVRKIVATSNRKRKVTQETRRKMSEARKGEKHPHWKGGISLNKKEYQTKRYLERVIKLAGRPKSDQCEACGIFGKDLKKGLCFDHDHNTGKFRGWLCGRCNTVLGLSKDSPEILSALIKYLKLCNAS